MKKEIKQVFNGVEIPFYEENGEVTCELTQKQISGVFGVDVRTINDHIELAYIESDLDKKRTIRTHRIVQIEGGREITRSILHYSLEVVIEVGMIVGYKKGKQFKAWLRQLAVDFATKGYVLNEPLLRAKPKLADQAYEAVQKIRNSEMTIYAKVRDLFKLCVDYNKNDIEVNKLFAYMKNIFHYAVLNMTAGQILEARFSTKAKHFGLHSWRGRHVVKDDIDNAMNYYIEEELHYSWYLVDLFFIKCRRHFTENQVVWISDLFQLVTNVAEWEKGEVLSREESEKNTKPIKAKIKRQYDEAIKPSLFK